MRKMIHRGDTIVEVCFALAVFSFIAVLAIGSMNRNLSGVQATLETTSVRNEIDAQTEALRFIHSTYLAEHNLKTSGNLSATAKTWETITKNAYKPGSNDIPAWPINSCADVYKNNKISIKGAMIVNTRALSGTNSNNILLTDKNKFVPAPINSRLVFDSSAMDFLYSKPTDTGLTRAEGIWFYAVASGNSNPEYYDFYIQACWNNSGQVAPTTIDTTIRLNNPDYVKVEGEGVTHTTYNLKFNSNGDNVSGMPQNLKQPDNPTFVIPSDTPKLGDSNGCYQFLGWSKSKQSKDATNPKVDVKQGGQITVTEKNTTLYAVWTPVTCGNIRIILDWIAPPADLDSHLYLNGSCEIYYSHKNSASYCPSLSNIKAVLDYYRTSSSSTTPEIITIEAKKTNFTAYFSAYNWTGSPAITSSRATVTLEYNGSTQVFKVPTSGSGRYWNVFAIKNGAVVTKNTLTSSPDTSY